MKFKQRLVDQKLDQIRTLQTQKDLAECTFKPQLISKGAGVSSSKDFNLSSGQLYSKRHETRQSKLALLQKEAKENKEFEECTFKPKIN